MTARTALFEYVTSDTEMNALGFTVDNTWNANAVDSPEARPFLIIAWGASSPVLRSRGPQTVRFWVHDRPYDYTKIDKAIKRLDILMENAVQVVGSDGSVLTAADPMGISEDLADDGYGTIVKNTTWSVLSRS